MNSQTRPQRAIFIDDDAATNMIHYIAAQDLRLADHIESYTSGTSAMDELRNLNLKQFPEYIFVDVNMPAMNGHEFMAELRELDGYDPNQTCVIFVTGSLRAKDMVEADQNEVHCYKWKPLTRTDLMEIRDAHACKARKVV